MPLLSSFPTSSFIWNITVKYRTIWVFLLIVLLKIVSLNNVIRLEEEEEEESYILDSSSIF